MGDGKNERADEPARAETYRYVILLSALCGAPYTSLHLHTRVILYRRFFYSGQTIMEKKKLRYTCIHNLYHFLLVPKCRGIYHIVHSQNHSDHLSREQELLPL